MPDVHSVCLVLQVGLLAQQQPAVRRNGVVVSHSGFMEALYINHATFRDSNGRKSTGVSTIPHT